jgi:hypothetical protein
MLSQDITVKAGKPAARRRARASTTTPGADFGWRGLQIGDQRVIELQLAAGRRMTITFLGNGQGDNGYLRLTHRRQHRFEAINLGVQRLLHHPNHACGPGVGGHFGHSVQPILLAEIGDLLLAADQIDFGIAPVAAMFTGRISAYTA